MRIEISPERCKGCYLCMKVCPKGVYVQGESISERGFFMVEAKYAEKCIACLQCEYICPDVAINVMSEKA